MNSRKEGRSRSATSLRNRRLCAVRAWLHDRMCRSDGCEGDSSHARRTQHAFARAVVDALYGAAPGGEAAARAALHDALCRPGDACPTRDEHVESGDAYRAVELVREVSDDPEPSTGRSVSAM